MALTGLQIQKLLPGTNCRECGSNTCLAFAMKLAGKKASLSECPYASDEAKRVLGEASEPPMREVRLGPGGSLTVGGETVLYRHEKTFVNRPLLAVELRADMPDADIEDVIAAVRDYVFERVGETFRVDMIAVTQAGADAARFAEVAGRAWNAAERPLALRGNSADAIATAASRIKGSGSVLCAAGPAEADALAAAAKENGHALSVSAPDVDSMIAAASRAKEAGVAGMFFEVPALSPSERFQFYSILRRAAIRDGVKAAGYPFLRFLGDLPGADGIVEAAAEIIKYGGIVVLRDFDPAVMSSLMTLRMNIFTDPQKPIQVEPKLYPIGEPGADSPVFVTTNFSLTYFIVSGEIENSGLSAWLAVPDCDGMSVLTAWAAGKFNADVISKFMKENGVENTVSRRDLVIPGYVSQISGELEDALPGWKIITGPGEAADIESFIKQRGIA